MIKQAYIDMDGVLADFMRSALAVWHVDIDTADYPKGQYNIEDWLNINATQFWQRIDEHGEIFWSSLKLCDGALELWEIMQPLNPVVLTSPSMNSVCVSGKLKWLQKVFGDQFRDYIFCPAQHKYKLAASDTLLIDDRKQNVGDFQRAGGHAYLWPHLGNTSGRTIDEALAAMKVFVDKNSAAAL